MSKDGKEEIDAKDGDEDDDEVEKISCAPAPSPPGRFRRPRAQDLRPRSGRHQGAPPARCARALWHVRRAAQTLFSMKKSAALGRLMRAYSGRNGGRSFEFYVEEDESIDPKDTPDTWEMSDGTVLSAREVGGAASSSAAAPKRKRLRNAAEDDEKRSAALEIQPTDGPNTRALKSYVVHFDASFAFGVDGSLDRGLDGVARIAAFALDHENRAIAAASSAGPILAPPSTPAPERLDDASFGRLFASFYPAYARACRILGIGIARHLTGRGWAG